MTLEHFDFEMLYARHADAWLAVAQAQAQCTCALSAQWVKLQGAVYLKTQR
jgi:hypothetical protein